MKPSRLTAIILICAAMVCLWALAGCGSRADMLTECSGTWQNDKGDETVEIQLVGDSKRIVVNGDAYTAIVERIDKGSYLAVVKVEKTGGPTAEWSLQQRWNDNGSSFSLLFFHDGHQEVLTAKS